MAKERDESLEETAARLGLGSKPVPKMPVSGAPATSQPFTVVDRRGGTHLADGPPPRSSRLGAIVAIVIAVIVVVAVSVGVVNGISGNRSPFGGSAWSEYPGTKYDDPREILAAPSLEEVLERADSFTEEFKTKLREEYSMLWQQEYEGDLSLAGNGYDGDSMLYDYYSPNWLGAAVANDPDAREHIIAVFEEMTIAYGGENFYIANDLYTEPGDEESAISQFGSSTRSKQALWSASSDIYDLGGLGMNIDVYDSSIPTDKDFTGDYHSRVIELEDGDATLFVTLRLSAYTLLSEDDREEFTERIRQYDEDNKP